MRDPFGLQQVPALMPPDDLEACPHREAHQRDERVPESYPVDVVGGRAPNQVAGDLVAPEKAIQNEGIDVLPRRDLAGRARPLSSVATARYRSE